MMQSSIGGEQQVSAKAMRQFEGLVHSTARMFAAQVGREEDDLAQELRIVVWRAIRKYDPTRSRLPLERYVFGAMTNKVKDYKRDANREHARRERNGVAFLHIEDLTTVHGNPVSDGVHRTTQEVFDGYYHFVSRDEVYGRIEGDLFALPSGVTEREANVLVLLMMDLSKPEIMLRLAISRVQLVACIEALRLKFSDWKPTSAAEPGQSANSSPTVSLDDARIAA